MNVLFLFLTMLILFPLPTLAGENSWTFMDSTTGNHLNFVWGLSNSDLYAVGVLGTIIHYDGESWKEMNSGTGNTLYSIFGFSNDIFAVGDQGRIVHYNGQFWEEMISGTSSSLHGVWGTSSFDVYAVGGLGVIVHYDGQSWREMVSGTGNTLYSIFGFSNDIFAVGDQGRIIHYNGESWEEMISETGNALYSVFGFSNDIFAVGDQGRIIHYNGESWTDMISNIGNHLYSVWGLSNSDLYAVGVLGTIIHYDGVSWNTVNSASENALEGVWGKASENGSSSFFAVGTRGRILNVTNTNTPPSANFTFSPESGEIDQVLSFDASTSSDIEDGTDRLTFSWDFGDGTFGTDMQITHVFTSEGVFNVKLTVTDSKNISDSVSESIEIVSSQNTLPAITFTFTPESGKPDQSVLFKASTSDDIEGGNDELTFSWDFGDGTFGTGMEITHIFTSEGVFSVKLTVTNEEDLSDSLSKTISVFTPVPTVAPFGVVILLSSLFLSVLFKTRGMNNYENRVS